MRVTDLDKFVRTVVFCGVVAGVVAAIVLTDGGALAPLVADPVHGAEAAVGLIALGVVCYQRGSIWCWNWIS